MDSTYAKRLCSSCCQIEMTLKIKKPIHSLPYRSSGQSLIANSTQTYCLIPPLVEMENVFSHKTRPINGKVPRNALIFSTLNILQAKVIVHVGFRPFYALKKPFASVFHCVSLQNPACAHQP